MGWGGRRREALGLPLRLPGSPFSTQGGVARSDSLAVGLPRQACEGSSVPAVQREAVWQRLHDTSAVSTGSPEIQALACW